MCGHKKCPNMLEPLTVALRERPTFMRFGTAKIAWIFGITKNSAEKFSGKPRLFHLKMCRNFKVSDN